MPRTTRPNQKPGIPHKETFTRINYMYQAAHLVLTQNPGNTELVRYYAYTLKSMAKKQVLRLHPDIKRTICKKCFMLLVAGVTATVRKKGKKQGHMVVKCLECETPKRFPTHADYKLWSDQPEAWFAMFPPEAPLPVPGSSSSLQGAAVSQDETAAKCEHGRCKDFSYCRKEIRIKRRAQSRVSSTDKPGSVNHGATKSTENLVVQSIEVDDTSEREKGGVGEDMATASQEGVGENMATDSTTKKSSEEIVLHLQEDTNDKLESVSESLHEENELNGEINANKTGCSADAVCVILNAETNNYAAESAKSDSKSCDSECEIVSVSNKLKRPSIDDSNYMHRSKRRRSSDKEMCPR